MDIEWTQSNEYRQSGHRKNGHRKNGHKRNGYRKNGHGNSVHRIFGTGMEDKVVKVSN